MPMPMASKRQSSPWRPTTISPTGTVSGGSIGKLSAQRSNRGSWCGLRRDRPRGSSGWALVEAQNRSSAILFPVFVIPAKAQGCPGKLLQRQSEKNRLLNFVLAGLVPAIHALGRSKQDVDTRVKPVIVFRESTSEPGKKPGAYALTPLGSRPPRPRGRVWSFNSTGLPSQIAKLLWSSTASSVSGWTSTSSPSRFSIR